MKPIKTVFDTNVYLAATKEDGYARSQLQRSGPDGSFMLYISPEIILEVREKLEAKYAYTSEESANFVTMILRHAELVNPRQKVTGVLRDASDQIILECALEARAEMVVTADRGLLRLKEYQNIAIIHPTMLQRLPKRGN